MEVGGVILHAEAQVFVNGTKDRKLVLRGLGGIGHEREGL
jgi:hypothetical protein